VVLLWKLLPQEGRYYRQTRWNQEAGQFFTKQSNTFWYKGILNRKLEYRQTQKEKRGAE
jgi:hypothetical protein